MPIEISIVIVSWNCKRFLLDCLASLRDQVISDLVEVIVVDNASFDGTQEMVREHFPRVTLIENSSNVGFARGNNIGIALTTGRYICLINPDVIVLDQCITRMQQYMEGESTIGMLGPAILNANGEVQRSCMRRPNLWNQFCRAIGLDTLTSSSRIFGGFLMKDYQFDDIRDVDIINGCFWMVRREALNTIGSLDPTFWMYGDDLDWCHRFCLAGWRVVFFPHAQAVHYGGGASEIAPTVYYIEMTRANLQYWRKYHNYISYCCYWLLLDMAHVFRSAAFSVLYLINRSDRRYILPKIKKYIACLLWLLTPNSLEAERPH